jgi:glycosyltransferase involved in cell wall biosynthesis
LKKVLLLNYYWPPCGGSAVQRWLDITNRFAQHNIQTHVVTIDEKVATFPFVDKSLEKRIHASTVVHKTDTAELFSLYKKYISDGKMPTPGMGEVKHDTFMQKVARFVRGNFFLPDPRKGWNTYALKKAMEIIKKEQIDTVFTAGPPQSTHLMGLAIKKKMPNIKWVADLHDYWTDISHLKMFYRTAWAQRIDRKLEHKVLLQADWVMTHCQSSKKILSERLQPRQDNKFIVHTMGYNAELFQDVYSHKNQSEFIIAYTGILGDNYDADVFFKAFQKAQQALPHIPMRIKIAGKFNDVNNIVSRLNLQAHYQYLGYISQEEVIQLLKYSSALLLMNPHEPNESNIVPGKIYEYLAAYKPIISISGKESENAAIIEQCNAGCNFDWTEEQALADYIMDLATLWSQNKNLDLAINPTVQQYDRSIEVQRLIDRVSL